MNKLCASGAALRAICVFLVCLVLSGCATMHELTGRNEIEKETKQELEELTRKLEVKNAKLQEEVQNLRLALARFSEKESTLSGQVQQSRDEKAELEAKLLSCRQHQKKLEGQLGDSDKQLAELIGKEKKKWTDLDKIKGEVSSRLGKFGGFSIEARGEAIAIILEGVVSLKSGKVRITGASFPLLQELAILLKERRGYDLVIEGHTDDVPTKRSYSSNWELSTARALAVLHYLERQGVASEKMTAVGCGEYVPRASNTTPEGRRKNRRVEILIVKSPYPPY